jgi:4'-phosphopantetheinyl transferase
LNCSAPDISWPLATENPPPLERGIHVWAASLAVESDVLIRLSELLSPDEHQRVARFKFDRHRNRFIAGRGILRSVLSGYANRDPADLVFNYAKHGKPELVFHARPLPLQFNLAHSVDLALIAVTTLGPIGVDVEEVRPVKDAGDLVARFFSARENGLFQNVAEDRKPAAFFNLWTRKEALLKATGEGITGGLNRVEVSFLPGDRAEFLAVDGDAAKARTWTLEALKPAGGFTGAVAVQSVNAPISCWRWQSANCG